jgi:hypothetical protein
MGGRTRQAQASITLVHQVFGSTLLAVEEVLEQWSLEQGAMEQRSNGILEC